VRGLVDEAGHRLTPRDPEHLRLWQAGWGPTLDLLGAGGARVVVTALLPTLPERVPACLIRHGPGTTDECDFPVAGDAEAARYNAALAAAVAAVPGTALVDLTPLACPGGTCPAEMDGIIVHRDDNHLSATFVRRHADDVARILAGAGASL
jgi:hypothetical protein